MIGHLATARFSRTILGFLIIVSLTGCVHLPPPATTDQIKSLEAALTQLQPGVQGKDAAIVAALAYDYPRELARSYHLVRPPRWHNLLINAGLKKRGLCYHWAEDLGAKLQSLDLASLELHWGVARAGSFREHNTVVVTARQQPFTEGIVLDPWRKSGQLIWASVPNDSYAWSEGPWETPLQPITKTGSR